MSRRPRKKTRGARGPSGESSLSATASSGEWLLGLLLAIATILFYQQAWRAGYIWDDDIYVTGNNLLTAPDGLRRIWFSFDSPSQYFPLVYTTFRFEHALWGLNPAGYHVVNIFLQAANAVLVWRLLRLLRVPGAWLAAAIFALHPVHVESVAWITERKNVLMGFFFLLALLCWTHFVESGTRWKWRWYGLALICYALALFSKTTACTIPAALVLILWWKEKRIDWRRWAQIAPFVALGIVMGLVSIWWERYHQGTQGQLFALGIPERIVVASRALWFYAGKLLWPAHLSFNYPQWTISASPSDFLWLAALGVLGAAIYFARRKLGRGPEIAAVFYVATLSPMLGFIMLYTFRYTFVADHYQYIASIGPIALAAAGLTTGLNALSRNARLFLPIFCGVLLLSLGAKTWQQCGAYTDLDSLWKATISENPASWMAYNNAGILRVQAGQLDEGIAAYKKALELNPKFAEAYFNLGNALLRAGHADEATAAYEKALELEPRMQRKVGDSLLQAGRLEEAIAHYQAAVRFNPNDAALMNDLGKALSQVGKTDEAIAAFRRVVELNPKNASSHYNLGNVLLHAGRIEEATDQFRQALEINPDYAAAHNNLGNVLVQLGRMEEALSHYYRALEINPNYATAHNNLGRALQRLGRGEEAAVHLQKAQALEAAERADPRR
jgi:tetratricopeptide (TPR) repeat protein